MTTGRTCDVLIVGSGPIGCRVASGIARSGNDVLILEQKSSLQDDICCTGLISDECFRRFSLPSGLILKSFNSASVVSPAGNRLSVRRDTIQAHVLSRPALDQKLFQVAMESGARHLFGHKVTGLRLDGNNVVADVDAGGQKIRILTRVVVLAAGFGSKLVQGNVHKPSKKWTMGVQAEAEVESTSEVEIYSGQAYAPGFFAWLVPINDARAHVGLMSRRNARHHFDTFISKLKTSGKIKCCSEPMFRGITLSPPSRTWGERRILVGDCAGQVKPITGGGLFFGLLCADIAADHLEKSLKKDDLSARMLSGYGREWKTLLGREIRLGRYASRVYNFLDDRELELIFSLIKRHNLVERMAKSSDVGFDWHGSAITRVLNMINPIHMKE